MHLDETVYVHMYESQLPWVEIQGTLFVEEM